MSAPQARRAAILLEALAPRMGRGDRTTQLVNNLEAALRHWEQAQHAALIETLGAHYPDADRDDYENAVAEVMAVLRGE